jgi:hypothetical protein
MRVRSLPAILLSLHAFIAPALGGTKAEITLLRVPDGGFQPQAQVDAKGRIQLIYAKGDPQRCDVYYVHSDDGGKTFSAPMRVNDRPGSAIAIGTVRGAQMAVGREGRIHVAWMGASGAEPKGPGNAVPMLYARLNDAGDGFDPQRNLITAHPGLDGGGSVAADGEGNVYVAWGAIGEAKGEEARTVYLTRSRDDGKTFDAERSILPARTGVCACCGMRISTTGGGRVFVAYRAATASVYRDMTLLRSDDHGDVFRLVAKDPWRIGACVMSTSAMTPGPDGIALTAWEAEEQIHITRTSSDGSAPKPVAVPGPAGKRKHPSIAVNAQGQYLVAWAEGTGWNKGGAVAWQAFEADGAPIADASGRQDGLPAWSMPAAICTGEGRFAVLY